MSDTENRQEWLDGQSPADDWEARATPRVLDELFCFARQYRTSESFDGLLKFVAGFFYAPFNAMLVRAQMPGARYVAPAHRWSRQFGRTIKVDARPLVILQPMGPVMFVFDVSDTEAGKDSPPLPPEVTSPFEVRGGHVGKELDWTVKNAKRDGIRIQPRKEGSQSGGSIRPADGSKVVFDAGNDRDGNPKLVEVPLRFSGYDPKQHILLEVPKDRTIDMHGAEAELPHSLAGISGSSLWQAYREGSSSRTWSADDATIVAVQTGTFRNGTVVKGTRWWVVNTIIHEKYPGLAGPLSIIIRRK